MRSPQATYRQPETHTPWLSWHTSRAKKLSFLSTQALMHGLLEQVSSNPMLEQKA